MTGPKSFFLSPEIHEYLVAHGSPPDDILADLIETTSALGGVAMMQIAPEQGALMTLLARLVGARQIVEVGTFTGYSALCLARGLAPGGRVLCCDISEEWTSIARDAWRRAGVDDRIDLVIAPAIETLRSLPETPHIDLAFVDADKAGYLAYYEELIPRLRPNGLLLVDNVLWSGAVADPSRQDEDVVAIRALNDRAAADPRVDVVMLAVSDGLSLLRRTDS